MIVKIYEIRGYFKLSVDKTYSETALGMSFFFL